MVPFLGLKCATAELAEVINAAIARVVAPGSYVLGTEVEAFEAEFARSCELEPAIGVANWMEALHSGLLAVGVGPGEALILPSNTYIATGLAARQFGNIRCVQNSTAPQRISDTTVRLVWS